MICNLHTRYMLYYGNAAGLCIHVIVQSDCHAPFRVPTGHWSSLLAFVVALDTHPCFFDWLFPVCCTAFMQVLSAHSVELPSLYHTKDNMAICFLMFVKTTLNLLQNLCAT